VRRAAGAAARALSKAKKAASTLSAVDLGAAVEGTLLGSYTFTQYKSEAAAATLTKVDFVSPAEGTARSTRRRSRRTPPSPRP